MNPIPPLADVVVPAMTDPLGRYWDQPSASGMLFDETHVLMTASALAALPEYSSSVPTGTYEGKMWKRRRADGGWWLCWYYRVPDPTQIGIARREVLVL